MVRGAFCPPLPTVDISCRAAGREAVAPRLGSQPAGRQTVAPIILGYPQAVPSRAKETHPASPAG